MMFVDLKRNRQRTTASCKFRYLAKRAISAKKGTKMVPFCSDAMLTMRYYAHDAQHAQHDLKPAWRGIRFYFNRLGR